MASASARAQSTCPLATSSSRWTNWRSSLGWIMKPSGTERTTEERARSTSGDTPVWGEGVSPGSGSGAGSSVGASEGSPRTSSRTTCRLALKSSNADSASSRVMSPRRTSVSVYSLRTERLASIRWYISGCV